MLRRPSAPLGTRPEEGCSSTAFAAADNSATLRWFNPAGRGYKVAELSAAAAVP
jgi:hypothetical protein